jgi:hypothetical protein
VDSRHHLGLFVPAAGDSAPRAARVSGPAGWLAAALGLALVVTAVGCGKKGPPLAPLIKIPAAPTDLKARRVGGQVYLQLKVPIMNMDRTMPADLARVDVYGFTGDPGTTDNLVKYGTLVA